MPPFQYAPYRNPYGPSIAEALAQQGSIEAAGALRAGNLHADAVERRGAIQAQMWGTVGNAVAAIPQQIRANKELALREEQQRRQAEIQGMQLDAARRERDAEQNIGALYNSLRDEQGNVDPVAFQAKVPGEYLRQAGPVIAQLEQAQGRRQTQSDKLFAHAQNAAGGMLQTGDTSPESVTAALDTMLRSRAINQAQFQQLTGLVAADPAEGGKKALLQLIGPQKPVFQDPTHVGYHPVTGEPMVQGTPDPGKGEYTLGDQRYNAQHEPVGPRATPALTGEALIANLMGRRANGETLNAAEMATLVGWEHKEGLKPTTVKTVDASGREVELHMTAAEALKRGSFLAPPTAADRNAADVTALSPAGLDAAALNYAKTGLLPPLGMGDKATRKQIINRAAEMMPGLDIASAKADYAANTDSLKSMQKQRDAIGAFEKTAQRNIDIFLETAGKVVDTGSPLANSLVRQATGKMLGSPDQAAYDAARQVAVNEIAKIVSNPTLAGTLSDSARHEIEAFNPGSATLKQSVAVMRLLKRDMDSRTSALDDGIAGIKGRISKGAPAAPGGGVTILSITPVP